MRANAWVTIANRSHPVRFSIEAYQDNRWKQTVQNGLEELNAVMPDSHLEPMGSTKLGTQRNHEPRGYRPGKRGPHVVEILTDRERLFAELTPPLVASVHQV
jgi:hypothetical protein